MSIAHRHFVSDEEFVRIVVKSKDAETAAKRLAKKTKKKVTEEDVRAGINFYRSQGVRLKAA